MMRVMGRVVAYLGPQTEIARPVEGGSYSLARQAQECLDGFGIGWYPSDGGREPVRVRSRSSMQASEHLLEVPRRYRSGCIVAEARALDGAPGELSGVQPLMHGPYLFVLEGTIERFREVFLRPLLGTLSEERFVELEGRSPAELLFSLWLDALAGEGPDAMANALETMVAQVQTIATEADASAALSAIITDGSCLIAVRTATHGPPPPLYTTVAQERAAVPVSGRLVASEPTFAGSWQSLDAHALMIFTVEPEPDDPESEEAFSAPTLA